MDFSGPNVRRSVLAVAAPMLVAQILNLLYNIVDRIYIGKIPGHGTLALAGLGLCFPLITLITAFANLFGVGGVPLCSIARGRKDLNSARAILANAWSMLMVCGLVLTVVAIVFHKPLLYLFGALAAHLLLRFCDDGLSILRPERVQIAEQGEAGHLFLAAAQGDHCGASHPAAAPSGRTWGERRISGRAHLQPDRRPCLLHHHALHRDAGALGYGMGQIHPVKGPCGVFPLSVRPKTFSTEKKHCKHKKRRMAIAIRRFLAYV